MVNQLISADKLQKSAQSAVISSSLAQDRVLPGALSGFVPPLVAAEPAGAGEPSRLSSSRCFHLHQNSRRRTNTFHSFGKIWLLRARRINKHLPSCRLSLTLIQWIVSSTKTSPRRFQQARSIQFESSAANKQPLMHSRLLASMSLKLWRGGMHKESIFMQGLSVHPPVHLLFMVSCPLPSHCVLTCSGQLELWTLRQMVLCLCQPCVFIIKPLTVFPARVRARAWKWRFVCTVSHRWRI